MNRRRAYVKNRRLKNLLRRFVLATALPPFDKVYRWIYDLVIRAAVRILSADKAVRSVYLRRGYAKGEWLPGLSDLDFLVIVDSLDDSDKERLLRRYSRFSTLAVLPDDILEIREEQSLVALLDDPIKKYRIVEGKATWKLLFGKDYIADIPELPITDLVSGFYTEVAVWWAIFSWQLLQSKHNQEEPVVCNSICYKAVAEILKVDLALNLCTLTFSREEALAQAKTHLPCEDLRLVEKLESIAKRRYIRKDNLVLDETLGFLLRYINSLHDISSYPKFKIPTRLECRKSEQLWNEKQYKHIEKVVDHITRRWKDNFRGAILTSSYCHELDGLLLLIVVSSQQLPNAKQLNELYDVHAGAEAMRSPVYLYILFQNTAFQVDATYYSLGWRSVLSPLINADIFNFVSLPEFCLQGESPELVCDTVWTSIAEEFCHTTHLRLLNSLSSFNPDTMNSLEFLRMFWKVVQLEIISRSSKEGEVIFAHSLNAIERALAIDGATLPDNLQVLRDAFNDELRGKSHNIKELVPRAVRYLKDLHTLRKTSVNH